MRKIELSPYDKRWPTLFAEEAELLSSKLNGIIIRIHHVGSTAIPGMDAKPVIDILLEVVSLDKLDRSSAMMEQIGYMPRGEYGIENRRYFSKGGDQRSHQIHAFVEGHEHIARLLAFRSYLLRHPDIAEKYCTIKRAAALASGNDICRYSAFKAPFLDEHLRLALMDRERI